jgi:predicted metallopeptidase
LTECFERLAADVCARVLALAHINPRRVLFCLTRARRTSLGGTYAKIMPMRFPDGSPLKAVEGGMYALPQIPTVEGDILYLIYIYLPRFYQQPFERRVLTVIHELFHIAPAFDGTIRRIGTRAHGASRVQFNAQLTPLVDAYLQSDPPEEVLAFLRGDFTALASQSQLTGRALALPKAVKLGAAQVVPVLD